MDTLNNHRGLQTKRRGKDLVLSEPYEHEKFSVRETQSEDDINEIKRKLATQNKVINEFENYIGILLSVMKGSTQSHYSDLIRKALEKAEILYKENIEYKKLLLKELRIGDDYNKQINNLRLDLKQIIEDIKYDENGKIICEKNNLIENVNTVSEELDNYSEQNNFLIDILKCKEKCEEQKLRKEIEAFKRENKEIKDRVSRFGNKSSNKFSKINFNAHRDSNIFTCFNKSSEEDYTISMTNFNIFN